ncbi:MAG: N-acetylglucosamine-6-phosphate deacetylase [Solobacterium sp.]|nr:N-acetylglucosamine-6-phosphate deacetylase [Solobacterium sp.]
MKIKSHNLYINSLFMPGVIQCEDGRINAVLPYESEADLDFGEMRVVPGFIDIHCHGAYGFDTNYGEPEGLRQWTRGIVREGVTGFLATTVTEAKPVLLKAVRNVREVCEQGYEGARILGIHFEGPYLDMKYRGAQPPEAIVPPSVEEFQEYQEAAGGLIRVITLAPEHDPDYRLTRYASSHGTIVSIGHSAASFTDGLMAAANGAQSITHTYNAMSPYNHRENGIVGLALRMKNMYSEIICDCCHSTPEALHVFFHAKNPGKAVMITDSLMCKGFEPGTTFLFGGHEVIIYPDGSAHLVQEKNLAGSTLSMNVGLRNLVTRAMVPFEDALAACTVNPASLLRLDDHLGMIQAGYDADMAVLDDSYNVVETFVKGIPQLNSSLR